MLVTSTERGEEHVEQRRGDQHLPAERHELIDAQPRNRPADPDHHEDHRVGLGNSHTKPSDAGTRAAPPAQEEQRGEERPREHVGVLGEEEHREAHARVLGHVARHEFGLRLGHVERRAIELGEHADEEEQEREGLGHGVPKTWPCASTIAESFIEPASMMTPRTARIIGTS